MTMLEIRLLGMVEVKRNGVSVPLPASKKSRALLAYLAASDRPQSRERLCELLWEGPDDPRAALRWSLTKVRPIVDPHLNADRNEIGFRRDGVSLDIAELCVPANATIEKLEKCAALYRGEFLEGLDLPSCFRFQQWCAAERERFRQLHIGIVRELTQRYGPAENALPHARRHVMIDPFSDEAHASLIRILASLGHTREAFRHYEHCRAIFDRELGARPSPMIEEARRTIGSPHVSAAGGVNIQHAPRRPRETPAGPGRVPFVGRQNELSEIVASDEIVLVAGEPGIGKSRLLEELRSRFDGVTLYARAFAAEAVRPYGIWIDAMREIGGFPAETDRSRLFDSVTQMICRAGTLLLDDIQWMDEASAALLHYVARAARGGPLRIICAARAGELEDNVAGWRVVRELTRDKHLKRVDLGPLSEVEIRALVPSAADAERVVARSGGNPLFALELARSAADGSLETMLADHLAELDGPARELVSWAAAIGRQFDAEIVGRATGMPAGEMLSGLEKLERCGIIRAAGERAYDFTHDLLRDAAYNAVSAPRRSLTHRHIARALRETHDPEGLLAGEIVHHAILGGDHAVAATAAVEAGRRCLRVFAYAEAGTIARTGLQMVDALGHPAKIETKMRLYDILVMARTPIRERLALAPDVAGLSDEARRAGLTRTSALGGHLLACLYEESNNYPDAAHATVRSAEDGRSADRATAALSIANTARCLLFLQRDVARAEALIAEAQSLGLEHAELPLALGYLHAHRGEIDQAVPLLERAWELAERAQDHWREWVALSRLVMLALENHDPLLALKHCERLRPVAQKMTGGSEAVRTQVLETVVRYAAGEPVDLALAFDALRQIDCKSDLAWALAFVAELELERGLADAARRHAADALAAAEVVGRASDLVIAGSILGKRIPISDSPDLTARARKYLQEEKYGHVGPGADV